MPRRSYEQFCGLALALDLVGDRWTLLLVRDLGLGPQRYTDLLAGLPGIGSGLLAERLKQLEADGVVRRTQLPPPAGVSVYELTDDGRDLLRSVLPLAMWGARHLGDRGDRWFRAEWMLLTLRSRFNPSAAVGVRETYEFHIDDDVLHVRVDDGTVDAQRGPAPVRPDLVARTDAETFIAVGLGRLDAGEAVTSGRAQIEGSPDVLERALAILGQQEVAA